MIAVTANLFFSVFLVFRLFVVVVVVCLSFCLFPGSDSVLQTEV